MKVSFAKQSLIGASFITLGANIISAGLGYFREAVTASYFGTTLLLDIFILAFTLPEFIASIIYSCLPTALIPSLKKASKYSDEDEAKLFWSGLISFGFVVISLAFAIFIFKLPILNWLGNRLTIEELELGERLMTIFAFFIFFRGLEYYFRGWLFEKKHFIAPVAMGIVQNVIIVLTLLIMYDRSGIEALAYGWLFSSIILFIYNGTMTIWLVKPGLNISLFNPWLKGLFGSMILIALIESITMIYPVIDRFLISKYLEAGYISSLRYAMALILLPNRLFALTLSTVSFPFIADLFNVGDNEKLKKLYADGIHLLFFVMALVASFVAVFSSEIVQIALKRGAFDQHSLELTSGPLLIYSLGIAFSSLYIFQMRFYYAQAKYLKLGIIKVLMFAIKFLLSIILILKMKHNGLALATVTAWLIGFIIMGVDLGKLLKFKFREILLSAVLKNLASISIIVFFWIFVKSYWVISDSFIDNVVKLMISGAVGLAIYLFINWKLGFGECKLLFSIIKNRFART